MLKLLLSYWQAHREPPPFVLTDDPLYCTHLSSATLPEVYSVNRVNPIFEDDNEEESYVFHKRTPSEEQRESETRSSDDTGYSSGQRKAVNSLTDLTDGGSFDNHMSSDSDDSPEALVVSADVHRVSFPDDVIILTSSSNSFRSESLGSRESIDTQSTFNEEPFDSLTDSNITDFSRKQEERMVGRIPSDTEMRREMEETDVKRPYSNERLTIMRNKLQKLLQHGTQSATENSNDGAPNFVNGNGDGDHISERSKDDIIRSLNRILNTKVPKTSDPMMRNMSLGYEADHNVTRTDSSADNLTNLDKMLDRTVLNTLDTASNVQMQLPAFPKANMHLNNGKSGVTRQDESSISSSNDSSGSEQKKHRHRHRHHERNKEHVHAGVRDAEHFANKKHSSSCKLCGETQKPLNLHQFLPGHWSYDNIYLPQMPNVCYYCLHDRLQPMSEEEIFHTMYHNEKGKVRHSWAPQTSYSIKHHQKDFHRSLPNERSSSDRRYSPDGSSHDTTEDDKERDYLKDRSARFKTKHGERRSLRVPKSCTCEECLSSSLHDETLSHVMPLPLCTCHYLPHRKVKFASDSDLTKYSHDEEIYAGTVNKGFHETPLKSVGEKLHINSNFHLSKVSGDRDERTNEKSMSPTVNRGQREPVKVDDLYRSYPMNFQEWKAQYRRKFVQKRRKRALNMVGMAIGIILVVGVAIAMTFIFLRLKRPT